MGVTLEHAAREVGQETSTCYPAAVVAGEPGVAGRPAIPGLSDDASAAFVAVDAGSAYTKAYLIDEVSFTDTKMCLRAVLREGHT